MRQRTTSSRGVHERRTVQHYGVETMLDSGTAGVHGRELRVYGYKWVRALVGKTQQILQIRFTVLDVLRPIIALSCLVQGGWDLSFRGEPLEAATHRATQRRLGLVQRAGFYFIPLLIAAHQTQHVRGHVVFSFEEDVAGDGVERHE
eukprot:2337676-Amphidinium_carterae.1